MPHTTDHQAINFNDIITVENYTEGSEHLATYKFPVNFRVREKSGGFLDQSGDGASGIFGFQVEYQFGRYNTIAEQYEEILDITLPLGENGSDLQNLMPRTPDNSIIDMGANGPTQTTVDFEIRSAEEILTYYYENIDVTTEDIPSLVNNYELIGFKILTSHFTGRTNEAEIELYITGGVDNDYYSGYKSPNLGSQVVFIPFSTVGQVLREYNLVGEQPQVEEEEFDGSDTINYENLVFSQEEISDTFGVQGVSMLQTFISPYDPYSGLDIDTNIFQNTNQGLLDSNRDGRIELGMFSFDDDNIAKDNFPDILSAPFSKLGKENLVINGDCKYVEKVLCRFHVKSGIAEDGLYPNNAPIALKPEGGWGFLSLKTIKDTNTLGAFGAGVDSQGFKGYGGRFSYVPFSQENNKGDTVTDSYWGEIYDGLLSNGRREYVEDLFGINSPQSLVNQGLTSLPPLVDYRNDRKWNVLRGSDGNYLVEKPHVAMWLSTPEAYSNKRCLCFQNYQI